MGDFDWKVVADKLDGLVTERYTFFSVNGTAVDMWTGFPADIGRALNPAKWYWQPISYPAATFPMGPSVDAGVTELVNQINLHSGKFVLGGYSQGMLVVCTVWRDYILNPAGSLHNRLNDVIGIVGYGNPMRCPGVASGNVYAGQALPAQLDGNTTGGIAGPDCLTADQTPAFFMDFANDGDLYASAPVGDNPWTAESNVGHDETMIYNIVQNFTVADVLAIAEEVVQVIFNPWAELVPLVEAIYNGGIFFAAGMNAPHFLYDTGPAIEWLSTSERLLMSFVSTLWADIKLGFRYPQTVRKEAIAAATSVAGDIAVFNSVIPNVPAHVQTVISVVQAACVFVLTLLGNNGSKAAAVARKGR